MKKALLLSGIISILLLSACTDTTQTPTQESSQQTAVTDEMPATPDTSDESSMIYSEADTAAHNGALQLLDATFCDKISDNDYKEECKSAVKDQMAYNAALDKIDSAECDRVENKDKSDACKIEVETLSKLAGDKEERELSFQSDQDLLLKITEEHLYDQCDQLKNQDMLKTCNEQSIIYEAVTSKNKSLCDELELAIDQENCVLAVENN